MNPNYVIVQWNRWGEGRHAYLGNIEGLWLWGDLDVATPFGSYQAARDALAGQPEVTLDSAVLVARVARDADGEPEIAAVDGQGHLVNWRAPAGRRLAAQLAA